MWRTDGNITVPGTEVMLDFESTSGKFLVLGYPNKSNGLTQQNVVKIQHLQDRLVV